MATPTGLSGAAAVQLVQLYTNETTYPTQPNILIFLNRAVEEVCRLVGGPRLFASYPTVNNQATVTLASDIQDIIAANFSMANANSQSAGNASPTAQGSLVYPMTQLSEEAFFDAAAGFPTVGFGPPQAYFVYQDFGTAPSQTLPAPGEPTVYESDVSTASNDGKTIYVVITYVNASGETTPSPQAAYTPITEYSQVTVASPPGFSNALGYQVYWSETSGGPYTLASVTTVGGQSALAYNQIGFPVTLNYPYTSSGANPPTTNAATGAGTGGQLVMQLYPSAVIGQVNVYYRARPQLWADTTTSSYTNLDSQAQEACVQYACMMTLLNRQRSQEAIQVWKPMFEASVEDIKAKLMARTTPRAGQVRDTANRGYPSGPWWSNS